MKQFREIYICKFVDIWGVHKLKWLAPFSQIFQILVSKYFDLRLSHIIPSISSTFYLMKLTDLANKAVHLLNLSAS